MADDTLSKFQTLLRRLFQFDSADLNFGIYRILNYKREQIDDFLTSRLPQIVDAAFAEYAAADHAVLEQEKAQIRTEVQKTFGTAALDPNGQLVATFHDTPLGKQYLGVQAKAQSHQVADELKSRVYNDLFTFFNRYYEDGDFICKRRAGAIKTYSVPYNGEEVMLHWANKDQYYIKTDERLSSYRVLMGGFHVVFELRSATTEQNNNKGQNRYYVLTGKNAVEWNADAQTLAVYFEHRPLTDQEAITYGKTETQRPQEKLNEAAASAILKQVTDPALQAALMQPGSGGGQTALVKNLTRYTRRNTSDFFIHKHLKKFLLGELDYFLKNESLLLDELLNGSEGDIRLRVQRARVTQEVAEKIINLISQVEDFQKRLFEKKKFIVRTDYILTVDRVPEELWTEVLKCPAQLDEWRKIYVLDEMLEADGVLNTGLDEDFLRRHLSLTIDTKNFPDSFKWRILGSIDNGDEAINGVLVNSENFQALNLIETRYREKVGLTFIDPPYNTGNDGFIYKDNYQHSTWLSMMQNRLQGLVPLLTLNGLLFISIDFVEVSKLRLLCDEILGENNFLADVAWEKRYTRSNNAKRFYSLKDTILTYRKSDRLNELREVRSEKSKANYTNPDNDKRGAWISSSYVNPATKEKRRNLVYPIKNPFSGAEVEHPTHAWKYDHDTHNTHIDENRLYWGLNGDYEYPRLRNC